VGLRPLAAQTPPAEISNAELLTRVARAAENPPQLAATVAVEQDLLPAQLLNSLAGGEGQGSALDEAQRARIWYGGEDRVRAELLGENGDKVFVRNGSSVYLYDGASNTLRTGEVREKVEPRRDGETVDPAEVNALLKELSESSTLTQAAPTVYEGRGAYVLTLTPKDAGSTLVDRAEAVIDSETHLPLSFKLFADGKGDPVFSYTTSNLRVGPVEAGRFEFTVPPGAKVLPLHDSGKGDDLRKGERRGEGTQGGREVGSVTEAQRAVGFEVRELGAVPGGRELTDVYLTGSGGVVQTYGDDWGTVVLAQTPEAKGGLPARTPNAVEGQMGVRLPEVDLGGGVEARELSTPIGTALSWSEGGVSYFLAGSVPSEELETAARGLR
jgi:outer membrane lipoprotein-sorting protein